MAPHEPRTHSCQHCQRLVVRESLRLGEGAYRCGFPDQYWSSSDFTFADFQAAQRDGCHLFSCVASEITWGYKLEISENNVTIYLPTKSKALEEIRVSPVDIKLIHCYETAVSLWKFGWQVKIGARKEIHLNIVNRSFPFAATAQENDPSSFVYLRPIKEQALSSETIESLHSWLQDCNENHPVCKDVRTVLPARIIELVDSNNTDFRLKLTETHKMTRLKFAALSYRWGNEKALKCLSSTIQDLLINIPLRELSKTIQDAVIVCRKLGITYIWVDALCIVQDDQFDKEREIAKMANVYGSAYFTIVAARASSAEEGFLQERQIFGPDDEAYVMKYEDLKGKNGFIKLIKSYKWSLKDESIDSRGWALQEKLLSHRLIWFGTHQVVWKCCQTEHCDGWALRYGGTTRAQTIARRLALERSASKSAGRSVSDSKDEQAPLLNLWYQVLKDFTRRDLSFASDRILAISGIAQQFSHSIQDSYVAGMWRSNLPHALLWNLDAASSGGLYSRPKAYQGPSWSWVSISGLIEFYVPAKESTFSAADGHEEASRHSAEVLECICKPVNDEAPFGALREDTTYMTLRGHIIYGTVQMPILGFDNILMEFPQLKISKISLDIEVGRSDEWPSNCFLFLAINLCVMRHWRHIVSGILLQPHKLHADAYERVGYFTALNRSNLDENGKRIMELFSSQERTTVKIF